MAPRIAIYRPGRRLDQDVRLAVDDQIGRVGGITLLEERLAGIIGDPLAHESQQLKAGSLHFGEKRYLPKQLVFLHQAHSRFLPVSGAALPSFCRKQMTC